MRAWKIENPWKYSLDSKNQCLIIAGEKSGEEHLMSFLPELKRVCPDTHFFGVAGDQAKKNDVELFYHLNEFSSWGYSEVFAKIPFYIKALKNIVLEVERRNCKTAILIDFQDFNLRLAKKLKKKGVNVMYYVAPQAWAWKAYRAKVLGETVHTLFSIIPFEKKWFKERGVPSIKGVSHPLLNRFKLELEKSEKILEQKRSYESIREELRVLLLPGSRNFEVRNLLPELIGSVKLLAKEYKIKVGIVRSPSVNRHLYMPYSDVIDATFIDTNLGEALKWADVSIAASGTVTLATALFEVPTVVTYKSSLLNEFIFYSFLDYRGPISLANLFHTEKVFPELIQNAVSDYNIYFEVKKIIDRKEDFEALKLVLEKTKFLAAGDDFCFEAYVGNVINGNE